MSRFFWRNILTLLLWNRHINWGLGFIIFLRWNIFFILRILWLRHLFINWWFIYFLRRNFFLLWLIMRGFHLRSRFLVFLRRRIFILYLGWVHYRLRLSHTYLRVSHILIISCIIDLRLSCVHLGISHFQLRVCISQLRSTLQILIYCSLFLIALILFFIFIFQQTITWILLFLTLLFLGALLCLHIPL